MSDTRVNFHLTADVVVLRFRDGGRAEVLLIRRRAASRAFPNFWALPGGHIDANERALSAAHRELFEETGVRSPHLDFISYFDTPGRDPRGNYVSFVFGAVVSSSTQASAGDDAQDAQWFPLEQLPELAFDHAEMIREASQRL
jgi:8-oxo-dGTP diphosphatase